MFRSGMTSLKLRRKPTQWSAYPSTVIKKELFTSKENAKQLTKDGMAQDSSKNVIQAFEDFTTSNEVKLARLVAVRVFELGQQLFEKHVIKNPRVQSYLASIKAKADEISTSANHGVTKKTKKLHSSEKTKDTKEKEEN